MVNSFDPNLKPFKDHGGKLLLYESWDEAIIPPRSAFDYYESVLDRMGDATTGFFRLFMAPGMFHCGGGIGTSTFDMLTPLAQWVERGSVSGIAGHDDQLTILAKQKLGNAHDKAPNFVFGTRAVG